MRKPGGQKDKQAEDSVMLSWAQIIRTIAENKKGRRFTEFGHSNILKSNVYVNFNSYILDIKKSPKISKVNSTGKKKQPFLRTISSRQKYVLSSRCIKPNSFWK